MDSTRERTNDTTTRTGDHQMNSRHPYAPCRYRTRRASESRDAQQIERATQREAERDARALATFYYKERILVESNWGGEWHAVSCFHFAQGFDRVLQSNPSGC
jgi:hypothetical protein